ncbi:MAG: protein-export chaperone SecB [Clostridia bacterium]|nr:protein-export chaperone SecB [Clostridia bacterium]
MKFSLRAVNAEELSFKLNRVKVEQGAKLELHPQFGRQVRKVNNDNKVTLICLSVKIESTESDPKPFDINVSMVGIFEAEYVSQEEERQFIIQGTSLIYPYLRAAVTNLTASAGMAPLNLPVINGPIFPEDRDTYAFVGAGDPNLN